MCKKGKRDRCPKTMVAVGGCMGTPGLAQLGPGVKWCCTAICPERGHMKVVRRRPAREASWMGRGQHLMDGWGARGIVHSNKETSGKLDLWQGGACGAQRLQPTRGPCGQGHVTPWCSLIRDRQTTATEVTLGALLPTLQAELRMGSSGP